MSFTIRDRSVFREERGKISEPPLSSVSKECRYPGADLADAEYLMKRDIGLVPCQYWPHGWAPNDGVIPLPSSLPFLSS